MALNNPLATALDQLQEALDKLKLAIGVAHLVEPAMDLIPAASIESDTLDEPAMKAVRAATVSVEIAQAGLRMALGRKYYGGT